MILPLEQPGPIRIGQYEIVRRLRAGGMATVYLARRRGPAGFARDVVLKLVHPHLSQENQFIAMFMDEARISARINHANVVHVQEFGEQDGVFFLVMEHVEGCALSQLLRNLRERPEKLSVAMAVQIAARAAAGLHAAHETRDENGGLLGIVHRDVSPSNILLARDGQVKIIDFGVAKARGRSTMTVSNYALKGKVRYMSPEQAWGSDIDRRSDIYSLAVVLWEALTGRPLFAADNEMALLDKVRLPDILPASTFNAEVSDALDQVIAQATSLQPDDRPATADQLRALLTAAVPEALNVDPEAIGALVATVPDELPLAVAHTPSSFSEHSPTTPDWRTAPPDPAAAGRQRRRLMVVAAGVLLVAVVAALTLALWPSPSPIDNDLGEASPAPVAAPQPPAETPTPAPAVSPPPAAEAAPAASGPQPAPEEEPAAPRPPVADKRPRSGKKAARPTAKSSPSKPQTARKKKPTRVNDTPIAEEFEE